jgi:hypothetical protein
MAIRFSLTLLPYYACLLYCIVDFTLTVQVLATAGFGAVICIATLLRFGATASDAFGLDAVGSPDVSALVVAFVGRFARTYARSTLFCVSVPHLPAATRAFVGIRGLLS